MCSDGRPTNAKVGKSHSSGDLLTHGLAWLSGKCGKPRHWVTLDDGSGRFQTVGRELCARGQYGVCILSWGSRDSLWQDLHFIFSQKESGGRASGCVEVMICEIMLSRCIYTYSYNCLSRESYYIWQQTWGVCVAKPTYCHFLRSYMWLRTRVHFSA